MELEVVLFRLGVAAGLGFIIGYERELHGRSAGLKTQIIVAVSSCLLMIISLELQKLHTALNAQSVVRLDPGRIASYAVAGMGFLGAGAIIQGRGSVQGVTTAACLWAGNAAGLAVGAGFIIPAAFATISIMFVLVIISPIVHHIPRDIYWRIYLDFDTCSDKIPEINQLLAEHRIRVHRTGFHCSFDKSVSTYDVAVRAKSTQDLSLVFQALRGMEGLTGLKWTEGFVP
ncbi:MAG: MgtC/SapB family protein [Pseudomonadota bacterium]